VIWASTVWGDLFRQMGAEPPVKATAEAVVRDGKIRSFAAINSELGEAAGSSQGQHGSALIID
jgi:hypothetical protein